MWEDSVAAADLIGVVMRPGELNETAHVAGVGVFAGLADIVAEEAVVVDAALDGGNVVVPVSIVAAGEGEAATMVASTTGGFFSSFQHKHPPMTRPEKIDLIVDSVDRYNQANLPVLEQYVIDQMKSNEVDSQANLAVLKLYQFNPALSNIATVSAILTLALASLPDPDFNLSLCLLSPETSQSKHVAQIIELQQLLETCRFKQFWSQLEAFKLPSYDAKDLKNGGSAKKVVELFPQFATRIRSYVTSTLAITYQQISLAQFKESVHLDKKELTEWINQSGCTINQDDATLVDFPLTSENLPKPALVKENIRFEQLTKIIGVSKISA
ncbi:UNVERIFIED_CONTAM: Eukaryotic translation initiation factor 3 subunit K [Siphonaria sp. JEL0065]|nr:Eukaryotic translation initiation factor 3 subunit K [Siphonaria sp. JEL0065]